MNIDSSSRAFIVVLTPKSGLGTPSTPCIEGMYPHRVEPISELYLSQAESLYVSVCQKSEEEMEYISRVTTTKDTGANVLPIIQSFKSVLSRMGYLREFDERIYLKDNTTENSILIHPVYYKRNLPVLNGNKTVIGTELSDTMTGFPFITHVLIPVESEQTLFLCMGRCDFKSTPLHLVDTNFFSVLQSEFIDACQKLCEKNYVKLIEDIKNSIDTDSKIENYEVQYIYYHILSRLACHMIMRCVVDMTQYKLLKEITEVVENYIFTIVKKFRGVEESITIRTSDSCMITIPKMVLVWCGEFFITMFKSHYSETQSCTISITESYYEFMIYLCFIIKNMNNPVNKLELEGVLKKFDVKSIVTCLEMAGKYICDDVANQCLSLLLATYKVTFKSMHAMSDSSFVDSYFATKNPIGIESLTRQREQQKRSFTVSGKQHAQQKVKVIRKTEDESLLKAVINSIGIHHKGVLESEQEIAIQQIIEDAEKKKKKAIQGVDIILTELIRVGQISYVINGDFFCCCETIMKYLFEQQSFTNSMKEQIEAMKDWFLFFIMEDFVLNFSSESYFSHVESFMLLHYTAHDSLINCLINELDIVPLIKNKVSEDQYLEGTTMKTFIQANCMVMLFDVYCVLRITGLHDILFGSRERGEYKTDLDKLVDVRQQLCLFIKETTILLTRVFSTFPSEKFNRKFPNIIEKILVRTLSQFQDSSTTDAISILKEII